MLDRVREAMFSTLGEHVVDARVVDLFAGTGSLGLEALSRGAEHATFVERSPRMRRVLEQNIATVGEQESSDVVAGSALDDGSWPERWDLGFYDPPYPMLRSSRDRGPVLAVLPRLFERAGEDAVLVFHAPKGEVGVDEIEGPLDVRVREYGTSALLYLSRIEAS